MRHRWTQDVLNSALLELETSLYNSRQLVAQSLEASSQVVVDLADLVEVLLQAIGELVLVEHRQRCLGVWLGAPLVRSVLALDPTSALRCSS